jgi:hypothetical protein
VKPCCNVGGIITVKRRRARMSGVLGVRDKAKTGMVIFLLSSLVGNNSLLRVNLN